MTQLELALIPHKVEKTLVNQRAIDGYINATAMCKAVGKQYGDYSRLAVTSAFLQELSRSTGIPVDQLAFTTTTGPNDERGTWVHPDVAINLGQWCSPKIAVAVSQWVREWATGQAKPAKLPYHIQRYLANIPIDTCPACGAQMISVDDYQLNTSGVYAGTKHICTSRRTPGCP